jgi:hypothetical protein
VSRIARRDGIDATEVDADVFLVEPDSEEVFHLNPVAAGLWRLLAEPMALAQLQAAVREAFPERAGAEIDREVSEAVAELVRRRLALTVP